jgi:hypothetical protein
MAPMAPVAKQMPRRFTTPEQELVINASTPASASAAPASPSATDGSSKPDAFMTAAAFQAFESFIKAQFEIGMAGRGSGNVEAAQRMFDVMRTQFISNYVKG